MEMFYIDGYWKDDPENTFSDYLVAEYDGYDEDSDDGSDEEIFFYGLDEDLIKDAIAKGENTVHDFVIINYRKAT